MTVETRLNKLEQAARAAALSDEELHARLIRAIDDCYGGWEGFLAAAATVTTVPECREGMDLSRLSDAEVAASICGYLERAQARRDSQCH